MLYDLFVIGGGSGGVRGARWAAARGAKVALCEDDRMGGTCVIRGCIPKKLMSYAAHLPSDLKTMESYGWSTQVTGFDWELLKQNRDREIDRLSGIYTNILKNNAVDFIAGRGKITEVTDEVVTIEVAGKTYQAKNILIATGGRPTLPSAVKGGELGISSDQIFHLKQLPKKLVVVGTGYIGLEFASIFNGLGSEVHVLCRKEYPLTGFDDEVRKFVFEQMQEKGIHFHQRTQIEEIEKDANDQLTLHLDTRGIMQDVSQVLFATGRLPNTHDLFGENVQVKMDKWHAIAVDDYSQTNYKNVFAVGDVTNRMNLTPVALEEAMYVVENLFEGKQRKMTYENIATAVFSDPQVATCGLTEEQALEQGITIDVYTSSFRGLKYTLTPLQHRSMMKMIVEKQSDKVIGLHMAGDDAAEMMQGLAIALKAGATKAVFDQTIGIHPTAAEEWTTLRTPRD